MNRVKLPSISPSYSVAIRDEALSNVDWWQQVQAKYHEIESTPHQLWLLFAEDSFDFSCCLFALLLAKRTPVLPPNQQIDTLLHFVDKVDAVCADHGVGQDLPDVVTGYREFLNESASKGMLQDIDIKDDQELHLFTSGSTGQPKKVIKKWRQLFAEVNTLEQYFGSHVEQSLICTSVSHQHIYGLLFTVLWPLLTQRPWLVKLVTYPEDLFSAAQQAISFVSSPSFLEHLSVQTQLLNRKPQFCVSSGGPLKPTAASALSLQWKYAPTEVFGSSETGGVAYRNQLSQQYWKVFNGINWRVSPSKALQICSPYLEDSKAWYQMDDAVSIEADGFNLVGRLDRVVKIAEKRVCLDQMTSELADHPWVAHCDLLTLSSSRDYIGAVVVLNELGRQQIENGKFFLNKTFRRYLSKQFEAVTLPRKWRYVDALLVNSQGKRQIPKMRLLFT
ncbi:MULTISPECIES: AMP-binding protein [unclassified Agarivorans]|uniref:AMP-binding protein n=1 Tax=unclassified Agarivorans TaxID=2636026 RepID=UPI0026E18410|nr:MULTISPECIES: class I adenylate-forming enzyme family protein [unclassified Agarivorans]MDO6685295.1 class I adenylate-forming enzyme family protein [Agarivorans sp. 3_MG-2023]MDO6715533.1 class I adenylate-forming enzyme family protein [Agarivorans sp. 2_MG-2023]